MRRAYRNNRRRRVDTRRDRAAERHNAAMWARLDWLQEQGMDPADWLNEATA